MQRIACGVIGMFCGLFGTQVCADNTNTVNYDGTLVNLACVIDEERPTAVDLGTIVDKELYRYGHSVAKRFTLTLKECDPALANSVLITLNGVVGSVTADGDLLFDSGSLAAGAVIGITDDSVSLEQIAMGKPLSPKPVDKGTMNIPLYAYLRITPDALAHQSVVPGPFTATLFYQVSFE